MTALIFGANGQDGFYLSKLLKANNIQLVPVSRKGEAVNGDVSDYAFVRALIEQHRPQYIFHLAANSTTRHDTFFENHATICNGTNNILEAVKVTSPHSKVFISGSALQFKNDGLPIKETDPFEARDAYSVCRIQSVYAARYYRSLGIKTYIGYFFNHDSPIRTSRHVSKFIADTARRVKNGEAARIEVGDITVKKEWTYAGDMVKAIWALIQQDDVTEAVLGSGEAYSIEEYLTECFSFIGKDWRQHVTLKTGFSAEYQVLVSNPATIFALGWRPEISFSQLAQMMITE
jgi:GDPmannose 4,6-dehydratase